jgi:hypothetical protein
MPVEPLVLALVVCDAIHRDPSTGKSTLLGLCGGLTARSFPVTHPTLGVYAVLTEGYAPARVVARVVRADGHTVIAHLEAEVRLTDPRTVAELSFTFRDLLFPAPEEVRVQVLADGALLQERRLRVVQIRPTEHA